ncbi:tropomyosin-1-like [Pimephales promelas]|uniref:tropomyosin-1-like n=1 Tax=Pimephales promelas TaxID=90988 RepID=UPI001955A3A6|nr:tropomyosin-1-like [Pimephales promelas]KAG1934658.1 hypothetical protein F2P79_019871 [Pimephales promelas]
MRRFFRVDRDEDYGQIQYLTAKCIRLSQEKAALQRELLVSRERQQALQVEMEALSVRVCHKEQICVEMSIKYQQLMERFQQEQAVTEDRCKVASLLSLQMEQVSGDLQRLQGSETQLMGLVDELHQEAQLRAQQAEVLETRLHEETQSKAQLVEDLEMQLNSKSLELIELHSTTQRTLEELRREHSESLGKLRETAEQFEWLCAQQRQWMSCVKRLKDGLSGEKESLELQVNRLQEELDAVRRTVNSDCPSEPSRRWDVERISDLQAEVERWKTLYEDLLKLNIQQGQWAADEHLKPP